MNRIAIAFCEYRILAGKVLWPLNTDKKKSLLYSGANEIQKCWSFHGKLSWKIKSWYDYQQYTVASYLYWVATSIFLQLVWFPECTVNHIQNQNFSMRSQLDSKLWKFNLSNTSELKQQVGSSIHCNNYRIRTAWNNLRRCLAVTVQVATTQRDLQLILSNQKKQEKKKCQAINSEGSYCTAL